MSNPQFDAAKRPIHLLTPEGWSRVQLGALLDRVDAIRQAPGVGAVIGGGAPLRVMPLLYTQEASGHAVLDQAAAWRGWRIVPPPAQLDARRDTPARIAEWGEAVDLLVMAHPASGAAHAVAAQVRHGMCVINMLDGRHAAPLAAIADVASLRRRLPDLNTRVLVLCGDLVGDARLRSVIHMLTTLGVPRVSVVHAGSSLPDGAAQLGVHVFNATESAMAYESADAILTFGSAGSLVALHPVAEGSQPAQVDAPMVLHGARAHAPIDAGLADHGSSTRDQACVLLAAADMLTGRE